MTSWPAASDILPHRNPFLFVEDILEIVPSKLARARWRLRGDEAFFAGHFPGRPVVPGVLQIEALAQCAGLTLWGDERFQNRIGLLAGVERTRFRRQIVPGDVVELRFELSQLSARAGKGSGVATVDGVVACEAELLFVIVDR